MFVVYLSVTSKELTIVYSSPSKGDLLFAKFLIIEIKINKSFPLGLCHNVWTSLDHRGAKCGDACAFLLLQISFSTLMVNKMMGVLGYRTKYTISKNETKQQGKTRLSIWSLRLFYSFCFLVLMSSGDIPPTASSGF